jgi:hypothetical protein
MLAMLAVGGLGIRAALTKPAAGQAVSVAAPSAAPSVLAAPSASAVSTEGPSRVAPSASVMLTVNVTPKNATVSVDGNSMPGNPYVGPHPADARSHRIRAEAPGFAPLEKLVELDRDRSVTLTLQALPLSRPAAPRAAAAAPVAPEPGPAKPVRMIAKEDPYK